GAAVPEDARMRILPADRERLVHLHVLAGLDAAAAQDALVRGVAIEGIGRVDREGLRPEGRLLALDVQQLRGVVDGGAAGAVVADGEVEQVVAEDAVEGLAARGVGALARRDDLDIRVDLRRAGAHERAVDLDQTRVTGLDRAERAVIADMGYLDSAAL